MQLEHWLTVISGIIWDKYLMALLLGVGIYYTFATKAVQVRYFVKSIQYLILSFSKKNSIDKGEGTITSFQALTNALASCVGNGNIVGVATAIISGGPGAIFWMWLTGILGMATKYSEIVLGILYREKNSKGEYVGGPMYYISKGMKLPWLGNIFAILMFLQICGGALIQSNALSEVIQHTFNINPTLIGSILVLGVFLVVIGGVKRLAKVTEKLVPLMAILYIVGCLVVILYYRSYIIDIFVLIFKSAFGFQSVAGGILGQAVKTAMRYGVARGLYSNEAGEGSAPVLHASAKVHCAHQQGLMGIIEVFVDTIIVCTISAVTILVSGVYLQQISPAVFVLTAFESVHYLLRYVVFITIILFAYSTIISQWYFGNVTLHYLGRKKLAESFKYIFLGIIFLGTLSSISIVWLLQDVILGIMIIPNLLALVYLRHDILNELKLADSK